MFTNFITPARVGKTRGRAFYHWPPGGPNARQGPQRKLQRPPAGTAPCPRLASPSKHPIHR
ncbi:hypothetical protein C0Z16_02790 [Paraburkholderia rhynchosiae]|uniref:Uncharacterized protein n=1 Tax=Paraburkholderia rhynchosiae TaxID=487049 RepID=A0ABX4VBH2_9BURK|nr:hypothetical protein C0Z16_02790 [Paraburkholderia rhynchosiae]